MVKLASSAYLAGTNSYHIESDGVDGLPQGWARASLSDIVEPGIERVAPATMPTARYIGMEHVEAHTNKILATVPAASMASSAAVFAAGNVLYGRMRPYLNKVVRPEFSGLASAEFIVFPQSPALDLDFLLMRLSASDFVRFACSQYEGDRPRVKFEQLGKFTLSLPPLAEQTRIVAKLEELLSDLDAGVAELKAAQAKLAQYRQSLLKAAVSGELTAAWRRDHPVAETGAELLARILRERRARWEQQQRERYAAQGRPLPKNWQHKYPEPVAADVTDLPELPQGWVWASVDQLATVGTGVTPLRSTARYFDGGTVAWVTSGALNQEFVTEAAEYVAQAALDECRLVLYPPGTLLVAMYGEGKTRGKCAELTIPATINQAIAALVLEDSASECRAFLKAFLLKSYDDMRDQASGGVQPNLNLKIVRSIAVPLPPLAEQWQVLIVLQAQLAATQDQQFAISHALALSAAQRQNILRAAFAGELVPQDPRDEPASALLARIRAERAARPKAKKVREPSRRIAKGIPMSRNMLEVLEEAGDWLGAQELFARCGMSNGAETDRIEALYGELQKLDAAGRVQIEAIRDVKGRKLGDRIRLYHGV